MRIQRKTYGIGGLLEWHGIVSSGGVNMKVSFGNGSVTAYGVAPATFTTSDAFTQFVIEHSQQYKSGFIKLLNAVEVAGEETASTGRRKVKVDEGGGPAPGADTEQPNGSDETAATGGKEVINVACKADAVEWLKERFPEKGYNGTTLRGKEAFEAACAEAGVEFVIGE